MTYPVLDIASKLLLKATEYDGGELMSNMKLQKMLYYQQGYHLAAFGTPLFSEEVEAWMYGPVVPCVYEHFKKFGAGGIIPETQTPTLLAEEEEALFYDVFNAYINFSALGLMEKTHNESPWLSTPRGVGNVISKDKMRRYFEKQLA